MLAFFRNDVEIAKEYLWAFLFLRNAALTGSLSYRTLAFFFNMDEGDADEIIRTLSLEIVTGEDDEPELL
jgi:hypothetical protein